MMTVKDAIGILQKLTTEEIRAFMRDRLKPAQSHAFDVLTENVSRDVLVLVSARALSRLPEPTRSPPRDRRTPERHQGSERDERR